MMMNQEQTSPLDMEWVKLIVQARDLGLSKEDVVQFLQLQSPIDSFATKWA